MGSGFWISYTDVMTALLFIFIIIILYFIVQYNYKLKELKELENFNSIKEERDRLLKENEELRPYKEQVEEWGKVDEKLLNLLSRIEGILKNKYHMNVRLDKRNKTLNIDSSVLNFDTGRYDITVEDKKKVIEPIRDVLKAQLTPEEIKYIDAIFIEGYTDDQPLDRPKTFGNWGLSALRAISFWEELKSYDKNSLSYLRNENNKLLFAVSGYANTRPIECLDFTTNKYLNSRCVSYQICMKSYSNYDKCMDKFNGNFDGLDLYNEKNRRIGIRFIPYHSNIKNSYE